MALITEDGTGLADAESYCAVTEADAWHAAHGNPSAWTQADEPAKETALRLATQFIDATSPGRWRSDWPGRGAT